METEELGPLELACAKLRTAKVYADMAQDNKDRDMACKQLDAAIGASHEALDLLKRSKGAACLK